MLPESLANVRKTGFGALCGAGISMAPPTSLPSWWDFNRGVLRGLADRLVRDSSSTWVEGRFEELISRREHLRAFTPDFMAQLMEEEVGADYFRVLSVLDSEAWNDNHAALAALAHAGILRAIITTNFDRLLERALDSLSVDYEVFATPESFERLTDVIARKDHGLVLIKAHGTVEEPSSMVDTLAQRVIGRPKALEDAISALLRLFPCLVVGFSGADLAYDAGYLGLRAAADGGVGLVTLVRPQKKPSDPMGELLTVWGSRGATIEGDLPDWLMRFASDLDVEAAPISPATVQPDWKAKLDASIGAWVDGLGTVSAVNMFTSLVDANADDDNMLRYLMFYRRYYRSTEDALRSQYWRFEYNLGRRLLDRGLIGRIEPQRAGLVLPGSRDVDAKDYASGLQFLARAANEGGLAEGHADLVRLLALQHGHGKVRGNVDQLLTRFSDQKSTRANYEIALLGAEFAEEFGDIQAAAERIGYAITVSRNLGDEPRRALALARAARIAALRQGYDLARQYAETARVIAERLSLPIIVGDAAAAIGMVEVLADNDAAALEPLTIACARFRRLDRRPRLLYALCDLIRATYYTGHRDATTQAVEEALDLAEILPGLAPQVVMAVMEVNEHAGQVDDAANAARELIRLGTELRHDAAVRRAKKMLARLGASEEP